MSRTTRVITVTGAALILVIGAFWIVRPDPNSISYHLNCIRTLETSWWAGPLSFRDYLRPRVWRWYRRGRPSMQQVYKEIDDHRQALVKLGYFETHRFTLTRRVLDRPAYGEFRTLLTNAPFTDRHWTLGTLDDQPSIVTVTACRQDMPVWSNVIYRFDMRGTR